MKFFTTLFALIYPLKPLAIEEYSKTEDGVYHHKRTLFNVLDATKEECEKVSEFLEKLYKAN